MENMEYKGKSGYYQQIIKEFAVVLERIIQLKNKKEYNNAIELIDQTFSGFLKLSSDYVNIFSQDELYEILTNEHSFQKEKLIMLAELLAVEAEIFSLMNCNTDSKLKYIKSLYILENIAKIGDDTTLYEYSEKIQKISESLKKIKE